LNIIGSDYRIEITVDTLMVAKWNMYIAGSLFQKNLDCCFTWFKINRLV